MKNKEKDIDGEIDFREKGFNQRFKHIARADRPAITLKTENKSRITIYLDVDIIEFYKQAAAQNEVKYQTLINRALRLSVETETVLPNHIKESLLKDEQFLQNLKSALAI
jgi:uncharacterized protein (DUF4415 family)